MSPELCQMLVVSTAHATKAESVVLTEHYARQDAGWLVYVGYQGDAVIPEIKENLSEGLEAVFKTARRYGCRYVLFDRDASRLENVPYYEW